jgi:hypothetical protein
MEKCLSEDVPNKQLQFSKKVAVIFIGTNNYIKFFPKYYSSIREFFLPKTKKYFFVFTDRVKEDFLKNKSDVLLVKIDHEKWPLSTMKRFEYLNRIEKKLEDYSHIIYFDADMYINSEITEKEFFCHDKKLFGVRHPNFVKKKGLFEYRKISTAGVSCEDDLSTYWQGCFWGGQREAVLILSKELEKRTNIDLKNGIIPEWHDESQLNKYFIENKKDVFTYSPLYAYPKKRPIQKPFKKKIIHMTGQDPNKLR